MDLDGGALTTVQYPAMLLRLHWRNHCASAARQPVRMFSALCFQEVQRRRDVSVQLSDCTEPRPHRLWKASVCPLPKRPLYLICAGSKKYWNICLILFINFVKYRAGIQRFRVPLTVITRFRQFSKIRNGNLEPGWSLTASNKNWEYSRYIILFSRSMKWMACSSARWLASCHADGCIWHGDAKEKYNSVRRDAEGEVSQPWLGQDVYIARQIWTATPSWESCLLPLSGTLVLSS